MLNWLIYGMVYLGSALMVYNVYSYIQYARSLQKTKDWGNARRVLNIPIFLLVFFLLGYLFVGILGHPDLVVAGILFGGSIFVFIIFKILRFITDRVQENEHLEAKIQAAEEISRSKTAFLSRVSHEMRTPMNAIIGLDTIALKNPDLPEETRVQLEKIGTSAGHLLGLIDNVLEMSTIESNSMELVKERFSLKKILNHLNELIRNECIEKGLEYQTTVIGNLNDFYIGDEKRVRQMLLNTLENAVKFTPAPGKVTFTIEQTAQNEEECTLRFIISDTGVGISEEFIPKLFSAFSQEDSSSTNRYGGSGLGMAITKNIVEKMNGRIAVESEKDIRTTFTITVIFGRSDETEDDVPETEAEPAE
ncbi:MAG: hypothetical protein IKP86_03880, partial [Anaerolineaceae bacterium]|nr:hypothetical protein [Anaerolineaceae bacterium]